MQKLLINLHIFSPSFQEGFENSFNISPLSAAIFKEPTPGPGSPTDFCGAGLAHPQTYPELYPRRDRPGMALQHFYL